MGTTGPLIDRTPASVLTDWTPRTYNGPVVMTCDETGIAVRFHDRITAILEADQIAARCNGVHQLFKLCSS